MKSWPIFGAVAALSVLAVSLAHAQQPPLVDRKDFFGEIQISGAQISPDGQWLSFIKPYQGVRNIWLKKAGEPFSAAKPISADAKRPIRSYFWSRDSRYVLYVQDHGGDLQHIQEGTRRQPRGTHGITWETPVAAHARSLRPRVFSHGAPMVDSSRLH